MKTMKHRTNLEELSTKIPKKIWLAALCLSLIFFGNVSSANAAVVMDIISGDDTETCTTYDPVCTGTGGSTVAINVHPAWQTNDPNGLGAIWVSYDNTGSPGTVLAPVNGSIENPDGTTVIMTITESFTIDSSGMLHLNIWADDTAEVFVDGISVFAANFTSGVCAVGVIGCEPGEGADLLIALSAGAHTITFDIFQFGTGTEINNNPFGILYSGYVSVPEPITLAFLGLGLTGMFFYTRRRTQA